MSQQRVLPGLLRHAVLPLAVLVVVALAALQLQTWNVGTSSLSFPQKSSLHVKYKKIVRGAAAGQGIRDRVQCKGTGGVAEMKRGTKRLVPKKSCQPQNVTFVTVFVVPMATSNNQNDLVKQHAHDKMVPASARKTTTAKIMYPILRIFWESVQVSMPGTPVIAITDPSKEILKSELPEDLLLEPMPGDYGRGTNLFYGSVVDRLYHKHLQGDKRRYLSPDFTSDLALLDNLLMKSKHTHQWSTNHLIFSDFDMIVVDDVSCVFADHPVFDVALTFRNNLKQPINSGLIMVRGTREAFSRGKRLIEEVVKVFRANFRAASAILGDQQALAHVVGAAVGASNFRRTRPFETWVHSARILLLPCSLYNWTPSEGAGQFHGMPDSVKVLHFKGSRKRLMVEAWSTYKQQGSIDFSNIKCLVLQSGRTKYEY